MERRQSNSLKRSLPRKHVSSICCPVTSSASRLVLLNWPPPDHLWIGTKWRHVLLPQRVTNARASIPAETAAQTRIVSKARIRLDPWKSVRPFKGIFCHDISEFESYCPARQSGLHQLTFERSRAGSHLDAEKSFSPPGRYRRGRAYQTSVPGRRTLWPRYQRRRRRLAVG